MGAVGRTHRRRRIRLKRQDPRPVRSGAMLAFALISSLTAASAASAATQTIDDPSDPRLRRRSTLGLRLFARREASAQTGRRAGPSGDPIRRVRASRSAPDRHLVAIGMVRPDISESS